MHHFFEEVAIVDPTQINTRWSDMYKNRLLTITEINIDKSERFFCIGSCFAEYVRASLEKQLKIPAAPNYLSVEVDPDNMIVDMVGAGVNHMNHYSPDSIFQELSRALTDDNNFLPLQVPGFSISNGAKLSAPGVTIFQDPYRREVYASSAERLEMLSRKLSLCVREGLLTCRNFIITLGLVEVFRSKKTGNVFNQYPGYNGSGYFDSSCEFERLGSSQVESTLRRIVRLIKEINSDNKIIFSVSPVPLQRTFAEEDVFTANLYSKSVLRAGVQSVVDSSAGIYYFPSYEIAMNLGTNFYQTRDLRHAKREYVDIIMSMFLRSLKTTADVR